MREQFKHKAIITQHRIQRTIKRVNITTKMEIILLPLNTFPACIKKLLNKLNHNTYKTKSD